MSSPIGNDFDGAYRIVKASATRFSIARQWNLLDGCLADGTSLLGRLREQRTGYDALVYADEASTRILSRLPDFLPVNERPKVANGIPCVSFFSGAGGLDIGFE